MQMYKAPDNPDAQLCATVHDLSSCPALAKTPNTICRLDISVEELDWEANDGHQKLQAMGLAQADYIIAADCLYIDEARPESIVSACRAVLQPLNKL